MAGCRQMLSALLVTAGLIGCGGGNSQNPPSTTASQLLISANQSGQVILVDARTDQVIRTIPTASPGKMVSAGGITVIQNTAAASIALFDNASQAIVANVPLGALPVDVAITPDGRTAWVAESNGTVQGVNTATGSIASTFSVPGVQRLSMGLQGNTLLAFNSSLAINFSVISTLHGNLVLGNAGLDHPTFGVFGPGPKFDDDHFYVLSCGNECGGTAANVAAVFFLPPSFGGPGIDAGPPMTGASVGLFSGNFIYSAGSPAVGLNAGTVQIFDTAAFSTAGSAVNITDGNHLDMALTSNNLLYIGSRNCTAGAINAQNMRPGCLSIFDTVVHTATTVLVPAARTTLDVTALVPIPGRNVLYAIQGGKLDIFDITTGAPSTSITPPSVPGNAFGVVLLRP
jgi:hypothetical protein